MESQKRDAQRPSRSLPDITLRDLCRWDRRLALVEPAGLGSGEEQAEQAVLDRAVSWAIVVRATPPLLPLLRGDELVILPPRVLAEIEVDQAMSREELLATLAERKVAALLTTPEIAEELVGPLPILTLPAPFPNDAESMLNRLITEQRAALYHLGNELSRRLSQAAVDPRGIEALISSAAELAARSILLQDADGNVIARGGRDLLAPAGPEAQAAARRGPGPRLVAERGELGAVERLITALPAGGPGGYLSMVAPNGTLTESDRLVLTQTAGTCSIVLAQGRPGGPSAGRQRLLADLLLGRLASEAAALTRGQALGIDPARPVVVGLSSAQRTTERTHGLLSQALGRALGDNLATVAGGVAFLLQGIEPEQAAAALRGALDRSGPERLAVAVSHPLATVVEAPEGLRQARFALALLEAGALAGPVVCCRSVDDLGVFALLYPLWGHPLIAELRRTLLGKLEEYDRRRHSELVETLDAYLSLGGALAEAAERLGIHRNTLSYRLQRIRELTGRDLNDPQDRLLLRIALQLRRMPAPPEAGGSRAR